MSEPSFQLDHNDRVSPTWAKLAKHLKAQLERMRNENDGDKSDVATAKLRGRIAQIKYCLSLANEPEATNVPAAPE